MCTVTWWRHGASYGILFNRDESRKRLEARPPVIHEECGFPYISPVDSDAGGTWIWVNSYGISGCLLNNYPPKTVTPPEPVSRGLLLKALACCSDADSIANTISALQLISYRAFFLLVFDAQSHCLFTWDGTELSVRKGRDVSSPLTTSGYLPGEVIAYRLAQFKRRFGENAAPLYGELAEYHCQYDPAFSAHSVLMSRSDARTVSQSSVSVDPDLISFSYSPVSEQCRLMPAVTCTLHRGE